LVPLIFLNKWKLAGAPPELVVAVILAVVLVMALVVNVTVPGSASAGTAAVATAELVPTSESG
jgi:hypothetical protein